MRCVINILMLMLIEDIKRLWLGGGYYGAPVVLEVTDTMSYRYVMRDHLGSITHVYTAEPIPTLLQELSYDAWADCVTPAHTKHTPRTASECLKSCFQN